MFRVQSITFTLAMDVYVTNHSGVEKFWLFVPDIFHMKSVTQKNTLCGELHRGKTNSVVARNSA